MKSNKMLTGDIIGLDLGMSRTGVARMSTIARMYEPLSPIDMKSANLAEKLSFLIEKYDACAVVVGLPRGLDGQDSAQTVWARDQVEQLKQEVDCDFFMIDEAGTTKAAEKEAVVGQSVDSVAAGILLEDFAGEVMRGKIDNVSF